MLLNCITVCIHNLLFNLGKTFSKFVTACWFSDFTALKFIIGFLKATCLIGLSNSMVSVACPHSDGVGDRPNSYALLFSCGITFMNAVSISSKALSMASNSLRFSHSLYASVTSFSVPNPVLLPTLPMCWWQVYSGLLPRFTIPFNLGFGFLLKIGKREHRRHRLLPTHDRHR